MNGTLPVFNNTGGIKANNNEKYTIGRADDECEN